MLSWLRTTPENFNLTELERNIQEIKANYQLSRIRKFTKIIVIGFFIGKNSEKRVAELTAKIQKQIMENTYGITKFTHEIEDSGTYLIYPKKADCLSRIENIKSEIAICEKNRILSTDLISDMKSILEKGLQFVDSYNRRFVEKRKMEYKHLWSNGSISLDNEQQTAILTDDNYNLVVAAAGSGKTEVLITRIAYLTQREPDKIEPNKILAIAYQRKAKEQIEQRLWQRHRIENVNVRTFHKLGKEILERSGKIIERTDIIDENKKYGFVKSYFEDKVQTNPEFYKLFIRYIKCLHDKEEDASESDKTAVVNHAKQRKYISINGTKVNSNAEKEIMDFLLTSKVNGEHIKVEYEPDLEGFRPDFYLPQFDVFIEHWGIDRDGNVPEWFSQSSEEYNKYVKKKKKWFAEHHRLLVQTYSYEFNRKEPELFWELLKEKLQKTVKNQLVFTPLTYEEILELVWESQKTPIDDIVNFITSAKTYGLYPDDVYRKLEESKWSTKQVAFGRLALEVFRAYELQLKEMGKTDFEDMINEAVSTLENNQNLCKNMYEHILVDEYQDISTQRLNLLKKLLERNSNCKLFCVGDDWQSIMGFSGSNLNYFVNFGTYFPHPAVSHISTNYRSIKSIVDTGADLIKNNGNKQVKKVALSKRRETRPLLILGSPHQEGFDKQYFRQIASDCIHRINVYIEKGYSPDDILVLTRFMRTKIFGRCKFFKVVDTFSNLAKDSGLKISIDNAKEPNAVRLLTVHKCKGLEARVVFVLNVVSGEFGFPSEIEDSSILEVARGDNGIQDSVEEERRLFYVAITRAKEDLYIYTRLNSKSQFLEEIASHSQLVTLNY